GRDRAKPRASPDQRWSSQFGGPAARTAARKSVVASSDAGLASAQRPSSKSEAPYDQNWVAKPVYIVCHAPVPRWPKPRTRPPVRSTTARAAEKYSPHVVGTARPAASRTAGRYAMLYDSQFTGISSSGPSPSGSPKRPVQRLHANRRPTKSSAS